MGKTYEFKVQPDDENMRIDKFVAEKVDELSRTKAQKLLNEGKITVNGRSVKNSYKIVKDVMVSVNLPSTKEVKVLPEDIPLNIIYEDDWLIVINKPAGMLVHPTHREKSGTLVNALKAHCELADLGGDERPGIVHRLDQDTSGVIVVAKNGLAYEFLTEQFAKRKVHKKYLALVCGVPSIEVGKVNAPIGRDKKDYTMRTISGQGKDAITIYKVVEKYNRFALLEIQPKTGRTHQIRLHMSYIGHPIAGDPDYGGGRRRLLKEATSREVRAAFMKLTRQALHAQTLGFHQPNTGKHFEFSAPIPDDMQQVIDVLREDAHIKKIKIA